MWYENSTHRQQDESVARLTSVGRPPAHNSWWSRHWPFYKGFPRPPAGKALLLRSEHIKLPHLHNWPYHILCNTKYRFQLNPRLKLPVPALKMTPSITSRFSQDYPLVDNSTGGMFLSWLKKKKLFWTWIEIFHSYQPLCSDWTGFTFEEAFLIAAGKDVNQSHKGKELAAANLRPHYGPLYCCGESGKKVETWVQSNNPLALWLDCNKWYSIRLAFRIRAWCKNSLHSGIPAFLFLKMSTNSLNAWVNYVLNEEDCHYRRHPAKTEKAVILHPDRRTKKAIKLKSSLELNGICFLLFAT